MQSSWPAGRDEVGAGVGLACAQNEAGESLRGEGRPHAGRACWGGSLGCVAFVSCSNSSVRFLAHVGNTFPFAGAALTVALDEYRLTPAGDAWPPNFAGADAAEPWDPCSSASRRRAQVGHLEWSCFGVVTRFGTLEGDGVGGGMLCKLFSPSPRYSSTCPHRNSLPPATAAQWYMPVATSVTRSRCTNNNSRRK